MRDAASIAVRFAAGKSREDLESDLMLQFALVRALEIIGEAAARLTEENRAAHPEIPWINIIGMRNRLAHGYFDVDLDIVWRTVSVSLPRLIDNLDTLIPPTMTP
ncbi:MAG: DUF86 domain-containing protein [Isosphaeraceae bacterium]